MRLRLITELGHNIPDENIEFYKGINNCIETKFWFNNHAFKVQFHREIVEDPSLSNKPINMYGIYFSGPRGLNPTGNNTPAPIYKKLLTIIKAFIVQNRPTALTFDGFDKSMMALYVRMFNRFLGPDSDSPIKYVRISEEIYVRSDLADQYNQYDSSEHNKKLESYRLEKRSRVLGHET